MYSSQKKEKMKKKSTEPSPSSKLSHENEAKNYIKVGELYKKPTGTAGNPPYREDKLRKNLYLSVALSLSPTDSNRSTPPIQAHPTAHISLHTYMFPNLDPTTEKLVRQTSVMMGTFSFCFPWALQQFGGHHQHSHFASHEHSYLCNFSKIYLFSPFCFFLFIKYGVSV